MKSEHFNVRDKVRTNRFSDLPTGIMGMVTDTWTSGPNEDFPQAEVEWDNDPTGKYDNIVPFEELEHVE